MSFQELVAELDVDDLFVLS